MIKHNIELTSTLNFTPRAIYIYIYICIYIYIYVKQPSFGSPEFIVGEYVVKSSFCMNYVLSYVHKKVDCMMHALPLSSGRAICFALRCILLPSTPELRNPAGWLPGCLAAWPHGCLSARRLGCPQGWLACSHAVWTVTIMSSILYYIIHAYMILYYAILCHTTLYYILSYHIIHSGWVPPAPPSPSPGRRTVGKPGSSAAPCAHQHLRAHRTEGPGSWHRIKTNTPEMTYNK